MKPYLSEMYFKIFDSYQEDPAKFLRNLGFEVKYYPEKVIAETICPFHKDEKPKMLINGYFGFWSCEAGCSGNRSIHSLMQKLLTWIEVR